MKSQNDFKNGYVDKKLLMRFDAKTKGVGVRLMGGPGEVPVIVCVCLTVRSKR